MENIIKARITNDTKHLIASYTSMNDINDILAFNEKECYIDCGTYTGDTVEMFILKVDNKYNKIFAFEPSKDIFMQLQSLVENKYNNDSRIVLIKKGYIVQIKELDSIVLILDQHIELMIMQHQKKVYR